MIVRCLNDALKKTTKFAKLPWTPEMDTAYDTIKKSILESPKLFFLDDRELLFLHTDASDYGIGAYLFQLKQGKEYPISFLSKTLQGAQLRWSTPEKEAYAIFFAITKLEPILRDRVFTLRTDHANLVLSDQLRFYGGS